jgi:hypothetical protein
MIIPESDFQKLEFVDKMEILLKDIKEAEKRMKQEINLFKFGNINGIDGFDTTNINGIDGFDTTNISRIEQKVILENKHKYRG